MMINKSVLAGIIILFLSSCISLEHVASLPEDQIEKSQKIWYDHESHIQYLVANNDKNLHLRLKTSNQATMMKILRNGLFVYFDVLGKKKKEVYLHYPLKRHQQMSTSKTQERGFQENNGLLLGQMVKQIPGEAVFSKSGNDELIQFVFYETDIRPSLTFENNGELVYDLMIPFSRIQEGGLASIAMLSLGIKTGSSDMKPQFNDDSPGMRGKGQGRSGGMGGGKGGGRSGGVKQGSGSGNMAREASVKQIDLWFLVDLQK